MAYATTKSIQTPARESESLPKLWDEVAEAVHSLKTRKSRSGQHSLGILTVIGHKIWKIKEWSGQAS